MMIKRLLKLRSGCKISKDLGNLYSAMRRRQLGAVMQLVEAERDAFR